MKGWSWLGLAAAVGLWGCGGRAPTDPVEPPGRAVSVELEGVVIRQYRGAEQRFELRAGRLTLDEREEVLEAAERIEGRLEPGLFEERSR